MQWSLFLVVSGAVLTIVGIGFLLAAARPVSGAKTRLGWLLSRNVREVFERPRRIERFIYRHHRGFGSVIATSALILLALLGAYHPRLIETSRWGGSLGFQLGLLATWAMLIFALIIGIYVLLRPSALKGFESLANRWIEPFSALALEPGSAKRRLAALLDRISLPVGMLLVIAGLFCFDAGTKIAIP